MVKQNGMWIFDEGTEQPMAFREMADQVGGLVGDPDVNELFEMSVRRDDTQRTVFGVEQLNGGLNNAPEDHGQIRWSDDRLGGFQEIAQAPLSSQDLFGARYKIGQKSVQLGSWPVRKDETAFRVTHVKSLVRS
jgi:hypothetical protein